MRKAGRAWRLSRARSAAPSHWLTITEAARQLDCSERSIRRYIEKGIVSAVPEDSPYGRRYRINPDTLRLRKGAHRTQRAVSRRAIAVPDVGVENMYEAGSSFLYGPSTVGTLPRACTLTVTLKEYWRYTRQLATEAEMVKVTDELRERLPGRPLAFQIRFTLDSDAMSRDLKEIASRVPIPAPLRGDAGQLQEDAQTHLLEHVIPSLGQARSWRAYLATSVRNFYRDRRRAFQRSPEVPFFDAEMDAHLAKAGARARTSATDQVDDPEPPMSEPDRGLGRGSSSPG